MDQETYKALSSLLTEINTSSTSGEHHVLHFPIISMRSYQTDLYDLTCDGNFNRLVSVWINLIYTYLEYLKTLEDSAYIWQRNNFHITVVLPSKDKLTENSLGYIKKALDLGQGFLDFHMTDFFPSGGPKQERSFLGSLGLSKELLQLFKDVKPSVVVYESEYLGLFCEYMSHLHFPENFFKTVFWCPVSSTIGNDPQFLESVKHVDLELADACDVLMVATQNQADYFKNHRNDIQYKTILNPMLIDPSLEIFSFNTDMKISEFIDKYVRRGYKIVYFPFRMTDPGYQFDGVMSTLIALVGFGHKILFLYSDPNDSKKTETYRGIKEVQNGDLLLERVPSARDTYYTIISNQRVVVPYLENIDSIMHASWQEMQYYKTNIVRDTKKHFLSYDFLQAFDDASRNVNKKSI